jgi:hypothetical protein
MNYLSIVQKDARIFIRIDQIYFSLLTTSAGLRFKLLTLNLHTITHTYHVIKDPLIYLPCAGYDAWVVPIGPYYS